MIIHHVKVIPPSPQLQALNKALSSKPHKPLSAETVQAQVRQHLSEAKSEMLRSGHFNTGR